MTFIWPITLLFARSGPAADRVSIWLAAAQAPDRGTVRQPGPAASTTGGKIGLRRHIPSDRAAGWSLDLTGRPGPATDGGQPAAHRGHGHPGFRRLGQHGRQRYPADPHGGGQGGRPDFVQHQPPSVQIGIVAFSDGGFSVQPPTNDQDAVLAAINRLTPQRGTSLATASWLRSRPSLPTRISQRTSIQQPHAGAHPHAHPCAARPIIRR